MSTRPSSTTSNFSSVTTGTVGPGRGRRRRRVPRDHPGEVDLEALDVAGTGLREAKSERVLVDADDQVAAVADRRDGSAGRDSPARMASSGPRLLVASCPLRIAAARRRRRSSSSSSPRAGRGPGRASRTAATSEARVAAGGDDDQRGATRAGRLIGTPAGAAGARRRSPPRRRGRPGDDEGSGTGSRAPARRRPELVAERSMRSASACRARPRPPPDGRRRRRCRHGTGARPRPDVVVGGEVVVVLVLGPAHGAGPASSGVAATAMSSSPSTRRRRGWRRGRRNRPCTAVGAPLDEVEVLVAHRPQRQDPRRRQRGDEGGPLVPCLDQRVALASQARETGPAPRHQYGHGGQQPGVQPVGANRDEQLGQRTSSTAPPGRDRHRRRCRRRLPSANRSSSPTTASS